MPWLRNICEKNEWIADIKKVTNIDQIIQYGIVILPGLIVNEKILSQGKIPTKATLENWIKKEIQN